MENKLIDNLKKADLGNLSDEYETTRRAVRPGPHMIIKQHTINYNPSCGTTAVKFASEMIGNGEKYNRFCKGYFHRIIENCRKSHLHFKYQQAFYRCQINYIQLIII